MLAREGEHMLEYVQGSLAYSKAFLVAAGAWFMIPVVQTHSFPRGICFNFSFKIKNNFCCSHYKNMHDHFRGFRKYKQEKDTHKLAFWR